jgi:hypothetical protein
VRLRRWWWIQRLIARTSETPLALVWRLAYDAMARALGVALARAVPGSTAYLAGSFSDGEPVYGVSDLDLVVVVPEASSGAGLHRAATRRRWQRLCRWVRPLPRIVDLSVDEEPALRRAAAATALSYDLDRTPGREGSIYFGPESIWNAGGGAWLHAGATDARGRDWRRLTGPERRMRADRLGQGHVHLAAWLGLQSWWRWCFAACLDREAPWVERLCEKLVRAPTRVLGVLGAADDEPRSGRVPSTLDEALIEFVAASCRLAEWLTGQALQHGTVDVRLVGEVDELLLPHREQDGGLASSSAAGRILPLADWRALAHPSLPDEALQPIGGEPTDPAAIAAAARAEDGARYPALRDGHLLVLPTADLWVRGRLRAVQCPASDPVSFALLAGSTVASFPRVMGWDAGDWARRAVAEHRANLRYVAPRIAGEEPGKALAYGFSAGRAAILLDSVHHGEPTLPLTIASTAELLADRVAVPAVCTDALEAYARWRTTGAPVSTHVAQKLVEQVGRLPQLTGETTAVPVGTAEQ